MADNKQHDTRTPPPRLRDGNPHGQFRPCRVRLFQERHYHHRRRQNGAGTGSGSRCYTGADLSGVSQNMGKRSRRGAWPLFLCYKNHITLMVYLDNTFVVFAGR